MIIMFCQTNNKIQINIFIPQSMQHSYFTPIKTLNQSYHRKLFNSDSIHRQGDWVCLNCQNLNYSFRKKCNRCKTQSRQDNQAHSVYSYYYYPCNNTNKLQQPLVFTTAEKPLPSSSLITYDNNHHHYQKLMFPTTMEFTIEKDYQQQGEYKENNVNGNLIEFTNSVLQTPKKKKLQIQTGSKLDGLPSVSPLVKKYRLKQHHTTVQKDPNQTAPHHTPRKNINYNLPQVIVRDFDQLIQDFDHNSPSKEFLQDEEQCIGLMKDIEDSIAKIII